jgi:hypothetical protein
VGQERVFEQLHAEVLDRWRMAWCESLVVSQVVGAARRLWGPTGWSMDGRLALSRRRRDGWRIAKQVLFQLSYIPAGITI